MYPSGKIAPKRESEEPLWQTLLNYLALIVIVAVMIALCALAFGSATPHNCADDSRCDIVNNPEIPDRSNEP